MPDSEEERRIDAKLEEVDRLLEELRQRRKELQEAKDAAAMQKTPPKLVAAEKSPPESGAELEKTLQFLAWKSFKRKDGEWTFLRDRDGNLREELDSVREFVNQLRKGKDVVVGKYRYSLSEDKFLNRYLAVAK